MSDVAAVGQSARVFPDALHERLRHLHDEACLPLQGEQDPEHGGHGAEISWRVLHGLGASH